MKILMLAKFLRKDGASTHIYTLAQELDKRGHEVHIMSAGPTKDKNAIELFDKCITGNIKHHKVPFPCYAQYDLISKVKQLITYILIIPKVIHEIKKVNPDVIHVHYPITSYIAWIYCKLNNKKFVITYHIKGIKRQILNKKGNAAIAISSELKDEINNYWRYKKEDIHLIFNGISRGKFDKDLCEKDKEKLKSKHNIPNDKIIIGFVGTYEYKKGIDILLEACSKIDSEIYHIVLVGDGDVNYVKDNINKFGLNSKVTMKEFQNPVDFYSIFDIFVLPSRNEGFPLVAIEAMFQSVPVVRSNSGGAFDMINNEVNGYIFENENVDELKNILISLLENKNLRSVIGKKGKQNAILKFSEDIMIDKFLNVYQTLC